MSNVLLDQNTGVWIQKNTIISSTQTNPNGRKLMVDGTAEVTGILTAPTAALNTNTTQVATTAFVKNAVPTHSSPHKKVYSTPGTYTWTCPAVGVDTILLNACGAGGKGGNGGVDASTTGQGGAGGGSGASVIDLEVPVIGGTVYTIVLSNTGNTTLFGLTLGKGGDGGNAIGVTRGTPGTAGVGIGTGVNQGFGGSSNSSYGGGGGAGIGGAGGQASYQGAGGGGSGGAGSGGGALGLGGKSRTSSVFSGCGGSGGTATAGNFLWAGGHGGAGGGGGGGGANNDYAGGDGGAGGGGGGGGGRNASSGSAGAGGLGGSAFVMFEW